MDASDATLVVLAGGRGRRMGTPKSALAFGGKPALEWIVDRLAWPGPTLLVTAPSNRAPAGADRFDAEVVDPADDGGPLLGILTALDAARGRLAVFIPVDMPLLTRSLLEELIDAGAPDAAGRMCQRDGRTLEPFPCVIPVAARVAIARHWDAGHRSLRSLVDAGLCATFDASHWPGDAWLNVNVPADLATVEARIAAGA